MTRGCCHVPQDVQQFRKRLEDQAEEEWRAIFWFDFQSSYFSNLNLVRSVWCVLGIILVELFLELQIYSTLYEIDFLWFITWVFPDLWNMIMQKPILEYARGPFHSLFGTCTYLHVFLFCFLYWFIYISMNSISYIFSWTGRKSGNDNNMNNIDAENIIFYTPSFRSLWCISFLMLRKPSSICSIGCIISFKIFFLWWCMGIYSSYMPIYLINKE